MEELVENELFHLLKNSSTTVTNFEIQHAYENFMRAVKSINQTEVDFYEVFRTLNLTRIEFQSLQTQIFTDVCFRTNIVYRDSHTYRSLSIFQQFCFL